jgi:hypothetical protein
VTYTLRHRSGKARRTRAIELWRLEENVSIQARHASQQNNLLQAILKPVHSLRPLHAGSTSDQRHGTRSAHPNNRGNHGAETPKSSNCRWGEQGGQKGAQGNRKEARQKRRRETGGESRGEIVEPVESAFFSGETSESSIAYVSRASGPRRRP